MANAIVYVHSGRTNVRVKALSWSDELRGAGVAVRTETQGADLAADEIADREQRAIEDLAETALRHVKLLPMNSRWRASLIEVADLASAFRQSAPADPRAGGADSPASTLSP